MPNLEAKQQTVQALREKLSISKSVVLTDYRGLKVSEITQLRAELRKAGVEFRVVKNTITSFAIQEIGLEDLEAHLKGPTAIAFGIEDPVAPAKILADFAKTHKNLKIKAGVVEGQVIGADGVIALAELPSREVLLAKVVGMFQAPITSWVNVLQAPIRSLANVLDSVRKQKEEAA